MLHNDRCAFISIDSESTHFDRETVSLTRAPPLRGPKMSDLPLDSWIVIEQRSSKIATLISMHTTQAEAEAGRDKRNEGLPEPVIAPASSWSRTPNK
jgi:hypothetical protein